MGHLICTSSSKTRLLALFAVVSCVFPVFADEQKAIESVPGTGVESPIAAARSLAASLAGEDDRRYAEILSDALELVDKYKKRIDNADGVSEEKSGGPFAPLNAALSHDQMQLRDAIAQGSESSVMNDPEFLENRRLLETLEEKITGGRPTLPTEFQDAVAVGSPVSWQCSGTLIAPQLVVTAGHCLPKIAQRIYVGFNVSSATEADIVEVQKHRRHKDYKSIDRDKAENDLGLLILQRPPRGVTPRRIATSAKIDQARSVLAVGFGRVDRAGSHGYGIKRQVELAVASSSCSASAAGKYGCQPGLEIVSDSPSRNTCRGDSGGTVLIHEGSNWFLAGAHSRATPEWRVNNIRCGSGGIHVRIDKHLQWIKDVARELGVVGPS